MRFDEVSAVYTLFGWFYTAVLVLIESIADWLEGKL